MPVMDGFTLARHLRSAPHTKLIAIVFLTPKDETEDRVEGFRAGVGVYLTKPFEPDELVAIIRNILKRVGRTRTALITLIGNEESKEEIFTRDEKLTDDECDVAGPVARGLSNKEIAVELNVTIFSGRTLSYHLRILPVFILNR